MAFPPDVYMIGAQKAGTTTLAFLLDQHPGITLSEPKEPHFLTRHWDKGPDWYRARFDGAEDTIFIDASTDNSALPVPGLPTAPAANDDPRAMVVGRLHGIRPDALFIYVLRDPVSRTYSSYWHHVRAGNEKRPFRQALAENSLYLRAGCYAAQIRGYLQVFPLSAFHIVTFEDLRRDPSAVAASCFQFLGLEPMAFTPRQEEAKNVSFTYARGLTAVGSVLGGGKGIERLLGIAKAVTPRWLKPLAMRLVTNPVPAMTDDDRRFLIEIFRERNRELEELLGRRFPDWQGR